MTTHSSEIQIIANLKQPLLHSRKSHSSTQTQTNDNSRQNRKITNYFKFSSIILGLIIGLFIQFSTLGANWLIISMFGEEAIVAASGRKLVFYSFTWSIITSAMSMWMLKYLRDLVNLMQLQDENAEPNKNVSQRVESILQQVESRFVCGALIGVNFAWIVTDLLLGLRVEMIYSFITFLLASIWSWFLLRTFTKDSDDETDLNAKSNNRDEEMNNDSFPRKNLMPVFIV